MPGNSPLSELQVMHLLTFFLTKVSDMRSNLCAETACFSCLFVKLVFTFKILFYIRGTDQGNKKRLTTVLFSRQSTMWEQMWWWFSTSSTVEGLSPSGFGENPITGGLLLVLAIKSLDSSESVSSENLMTDDWTLMLMFDKNLLVNRCKKSNNM